MFNPCCCDTIDPDCIIFADDFATDRLSTKWIQSVGTWIVSGDYLTPGATGDKILTVDEDDAAGDQFLETRVTATQGGGTPKVRLMLDVVDADNYHCATVHILPSSIKIYISKFVAGAETALGNSTITWDASFLEEEPTDIKFCLSASRLRCSVFSPWNGGYLGSYSITSGITLLNGLKAGLLAVDKPGSMAFRYVNFYRLATASNYGCGYCSESCAPYCDDEFPSPPAVIVDLGVTGITDGTNCECDYITGAFICEQTGCSAFGYNHDSSCAFRPCNPQPSRFEIRVTSDYRVVAGIYERRWIIKVYHRGTVRNPACSSQEIYDEWYYTPWDDDAEFCSLPAVVTADLDVPRNESIGGTLYCTGALPATITIERV